jgi:hypothetical protein
MNIRSVLRLTVSLSCVGAWCFAAPAATRPNVVLVMMDDMGYGDLSCHGSPFVKTPHLDALRTGEL